MPNTPDLVLAIDIKTTPERLWEALTETRLHRQYFHGTTVEGELRVGGRLINRDNKGVIQVESTVLDIVPGRTLVTTFEHKWTTDGEPTSVRYEISPLADGCRLTITHYDFAKSRAGVDTGWPKILSALKILLETGTPVPEMAG